MAYFNENEVTYLKCVAIWSTEEIMFLCGGIIASPHSGKNSSVLNRRPAERFLSVCRSNLYILLLRQTDRNPPAKEVNLVEADRTYNNLTLLCNNMPLIADNKGRPPLIPPLWGEHM